MNEIIFQCKRFSATGRREDVAAREHAHGSSEPRSFSHSLDIDISNSSSRIETGQETNGHVREGEQTQVLDDRHQVVVETGEGDKTGPDSRGDPRGASWASKLGEDAE